MARQLPPAPTAPTAAERRWRWFRELAVCVLTRAGEADALAAVRAAVAGQEPAVFDGSPPRLSVTGHDMRAWVMTETVWAALARHPRAEALLERALDAVALELLRRGEAGEQVEAEDLDPAGVEPPPAQDGEAAPPDPGEVDWSPDAPQWNPPPAPPPEPAPADEPSPLELTEPPPAPPPPAPPPRPRQFPCWPDRPRW
jgi:hypothetical protein